MYVAKLISSAVAVTAPFAILVYDMVVYAFFGPEATISSVVERWSLQWHELPYVTAGLFLWLWLHFFATTFTQR